MNDNSEIYVVIVAAGSGSRFGGDLPKQFCRLDGRPVLMRTVDCFRRSLPGARIVTVVSAGMTDYWAGLCRSHGFEQPETVVGGRSRWESVKNALSAIDGAGEGAIVLVHDGARPLVDEGVIRRVLKGLETAHAVIPAVAVTDSLRRVGGDGRAEAVDRSEYRSVQTPQGFRLDELKRAYGLPYSEAFTDDASVMSAAGMDDVMLVEGSNENIKITNPGDMALAAFYLSRR